MEIFQKILLNPFFTLEKCGKEHEKIRENYGQPRGQGENKPNFRNAQMSANVFATKEYENKSIVYLTDINEKIFVFRQEFEIWCFHLSSNLTFVESKW